MTITTRALKLVDQVSHILPIQWTRTPTIDHEVLDPFLHWLLSIKKIQNKLPMSSGSPTEARQAFRSDVLKLRVGYPVDEVSDFFIPGAESALRCRHYRPLKGHACDALMIYFHGGGFVIGDLDTHDDICRLICREGGFQVLSIDYRLAPEHPFPAAIQDAEHVTHWVLKNIDLFGISPDRVVLGGDSAGANLATVTVQTMAQQGHPIAAQLLFYPGTDHSTERRSKHVFSEGLFLSKEDRIWFYQHYLKSAAVDNQRISPLLIDDLKGIAPAVVVTAALDMLRDEGVAYANKLAEGDALIAHLSATGLGHGFVNLIGVHQRSEDMAIQAIDCLRNSLTQ